jgi:hypothetical protein
MASSFYPSFFTDLLTGEIVNLETSTVKCLLLKDTYNFSVSHSTVFDIKASEPVNNGSTVIGYSRKTIPATISLDLTTNEEGAALNFDLTNNAIWSAATFTVSGAALYVSEDENDDTLNKLIYYIDFSDTESVTLDTFKILDPVPAPKIRRS